VQIPRPSSDDPRRPSAFARPAAAPLSIPPRGTVERFCRDLVAATCLEDKLEPAPPPPLDRAASWEAAPPARRIAAPGRPAELRVVARSPRTPRAAAWTRPAVRARVLHVSLHHELQAAELFAWAVLAFPGAPRAFRAGLVRLCLEELAHLRLYAAHLATLGFAVGAFPVRDWFWERVVTCADPVAFVALQGVGLEGGNLEHGARFAAAFRAAGDEAGARIFERVAREEVAHVAFAARWFARLSGAPLDYARWRAALPAPLTPALLRGRPLNRAARARAGLDAAFLDALEAEPATTERRDA
jgi:uncharacterized ferritin-like protein (DUF455 family)